MWRSSTIFTIALPPPPLPNVIDAGGPSTGISSIALPGTGVPFTIASFFVAVGRGVPPTDTDVDPLRGVPSICGAGVLGERSNGVMVGAAFTPDDTGKAGAPETSATAVGVASVPLASATGSPVRPARCASFMPMAAAMPPPKPTNTPMINSFLPFMCAGRVYPQPESPRGPCGALAAISAGSSPQGEREERGLR